VVAGAGVAALVIGFSAKSSLADLIAGLSLAIYTRSSRDSMLSRAEADAALVVTLFH
jgi:hypothetical protein